MARKKKANIQHIMCENIKSQCKIGTKKRADRAEHGGKAKYIHGYKTADNYYQIAKQYAQWLKAQGLNYATIEEARAHAEEFIKKDGHNSAWTQSKYRDALGRALMCEPSSLCSVPKRHANAIKRGRALTEREIKWRANHAEDVLIFRSCGLRREEYGKVQKRDIIDKGGALYIHVRDGKGGKDRYQRVIDGKGADALRNRLKSLNNSSDKVWDKVPSNCNLHAMRADYARTLYDIECEVFANTDSAPYKPHSGGTYNRDALAVVAQNMGHGGHRAHTTVASYLSYGQNFLADN